MKATIVPDQLFCEPGSNGSWINRFARQQVLNKLTQLKHGELIIHENSQVTHYGESGPQENFRIHVEVLHPGFWADIAFSGGVGAGEAYIKGFWRCNDLQGLLRLMIRNRSLTDELDEHWLSFKRPLLKMLHLVNKNSRKGSSKNIREHYDLGNAFFQLFLDRSMMYSCAVYDEQTESLESASYAKIRRIAEKLSLKPEDHLLEIGTGWGGMALYAAREYGCRVTTTTISVEQYRYAKARIADAGLSHRVRVLLQDYRDLEGQYDKIVSIEMIEAVGHQYLDTYFKQCSRLLKPSGMMLLQAITITDHRYKAALKRVDFIKRYIFPGGFLPSVSVMTKSLSKVSQMKVIHLEDIGQHYASTLSDWKKRFLNRIEDVRAMGYSDNFIRMWEYYLDYCRAGFAENYLGTVQMLMYKEDSYQSPIRK